MNGAQNRVSILTLVPLIEETSGIKSLSDKPDILSELALEAEHKIGTEEAFNHISSFNQRRHHDCFVTICNYRGKLPDDCYSIQDIKFSFIATIACVCNQSPCVCSASSACSCGLNPCTCGAFSYYKPMRQDIYREDCFLVCPFPNGKVVIDYIALPTDSQGFLMILESHRDAIQAFIEWQLLKSKYITRQIDEGIYREFKERWMDLCLQARAADNLPPRNELADAASLNNDPYKMIPWGWGFGYGDNGGYGGGW